MDSHVGDITHYSFIILKEPVSLRVIIGAVLITCGSIVMMTK